MSALIALSPLLASLYIFPYLELRQNAKCEAKQHKYLECFVESYNALHFIYDCHMHPYTHNKFTPCTSVHQPASHTLSFLFLLFAKTKSHLSHISQPPTSLSETEPRNWNCQNISFNERSQHLFARAVTIHEHPALLAKKMKISTSYDLCSINSPYKLDNSN